MLFSPKLIHNYINSAPFVMLSSGVLGGIIGIEKEVLDIHPEAVPITAAMNIIRYTFFGVVYGSIYPLSIPMTFIHMFYFSKLKYPTCYFYPYYMMFSNSKSK